MTPYDPKRPLFQNGDSIFRKNDPSDDDPYERGFADKLYGTDEEYFESDLYDDPEDPETERQPVYQPRRKGKKKKHRFGRILLRLVCIFLFLTAALVVGLHFYGKQPTGSSPEARKSGCSTILIAGTDESGDRTDTIMLLNVNRKTKQISLLSIPRDTKVNCSYSPQKINGAYGVNDKGADGMNALMDYVADCVGFRPDGYLLVDLDVFVELVDLFGGVEFDVPQDMDYDDPWQELSIHLSAGMQTLNGQQAMGLVRYRSGYAMADLQRVNVQREFIMSAISQWKSPKNLFRFLRALSLLEKYSQTDLSTRNLIWLAESALLCGTGDMMMETIPYYLGEIYVYVDADDAYLNLINTYFNPYTRDIGYGDLNIAD